MTRVTLTRIHRYLPLTVLGRLASEHGGEFFGTTLNSELQFGFAHLSQAKRFQHHLVRKMQYKLIATIS